MQDWEKLLEKCLPMGHRLVGEGMAEQLLSRGTREAGVMLQSPGHPEPPSPSTRDAGLS